MFLDSSLLIKYMPKGLVFITGMFYEVCRRIALDNHLANVCFHYENNLGLFTVCDFVSFANRFVGIYLLLIEGALRWKISRNLVVW